MEEPSQYTHALLSNLLSQEFRTNQSQVTAGLHREDVANPNACSFSLALCVQQGLPPLVKNEVHLGLR